MADADNRSVVAQFHKAENGRYSLWSVVTEEAAIGHDGKSLRRRTCYDVTLSKRHGYLFHASGFGGCEPVIVGSPYYASAGFCISESPCTLIDSDDNEPYTSEKTRAIRERNKTRRLSAVPRAFKLEPGQDILDWLTCHAIDTPSVYCSECDDSMPDDELCEHCWWCEKISWFSTPSDRCGCPDRIICEPA